jgi:uncharacterized protein (TIGR02001 family)
LVAGLSGASTPALFRPECAHARGETEDSAVENPQRELVAPDAEDAGKFDASLMLATENVDRGVSLSAGRPAVRAVLSYSLYDRFCVEVQAANVEFARGEDQALVDLDVGFGDSLTEHLYWGAGVCYSILSEAPSEVACEARFELRYAASALKLAPEIGLTYYWSPDIWGNPLYAEATLDLSLSHHTRFSTRVGRQHHRSRCTDWEVALYEQIENIELGIAHTATNLDHPLATARVVLSISLQL